MVVLKYAQGPEYAHISAKNSHLNRSAFRNHVHHSGRTVASTGRVFALTHNYSGYPLVRQARAMVQAGELGEVQEVRSSYIQGFLRGLPPGMPSLRAWKSDPRGDYV